MHKNEKKRAYEQRILNIEDTSFLPVVLSCIGGLGQIAFTTNKGIASLLSNKWDQPYIVVYVLAPM